MYRRRWEGIQEVKARWGVRVGFLTVIVPGYFRQGRGRTSEYALGREGELSFLACETTTA